MMMQRTDLLINQIEHLGTSNTITMNTISLKHRLLLISFIIIAILFTPAVQLEGQNQNRTASTKVVDALNQMPAGNKDLFNRLMSDIISTGEEGIDLLINMLKRKDDSMVSVQYALNGVSVYASQNDFDQSIKSLLTNKYQTLLTDIKSTSKGNENDDLIAFITKQLTTLGINQSEKPIKNLPTLKRAKKNLATATKSADRCAAIQDYIAVAGIVKGEKVILKSISDTNREYRFATLYAIGKKEPVLLYDKIGEMLPSLEDDIKEDIIYWFGEMKDPYNTSTLLKYLDYPNPIIVEKATWALTNIGTEEAISKISLFLTSKDPKMINLAKLALLSSAGDLSGGLIEIFPSCGNDGKKAIIEILAHRKSVANKENVFNLLSSEDIDIKFCAFKYLRDFVTTSDTTRLFSLLENEEIVFAEDIRQAILSSLFEKSEKEKNMIFLNKKSGVLSEQIKNRYWPLIIATSDTDQLYQLSLYFKEHPNPTSPQTGGIALFDLTLKSYVESVNTSKIEGEQRFILLRKAMEIADNIDQKKMIIDAMGRTGSFPCLFFLANIINNESVQQNVAYAIKRIALNHPEYYGKEITEMLEKVCTVIKGNDAQYEITSIQNHLAKVPKGAGYVSMFNGKDLSGWKGLVENPFVRAKLSQKDHENAQKEADVKMMENWKVEDGSIVYVGKGYDNLCSEKMYGDFEMYIDWMLDPNGKEPDAGIYLRGTPQVQIWDTSRVDVGAQVGSGGLYNNISNISKPLKVADNKIGEWNNLYIKMIGERVTVRLNGVLVVDNTVLENYWDRRYPIFPIEQIELQAHGSRVYFRNIYINEFEKTEPCKLSKNEESEGFELLFDGISLQKWIGNKVDYITEDGVIAVRPTGQGFGNLYTQETFEDFVFRFEFRLTPGANNGIGIRAPIEGDAAYEGMEIQVLDHYNAIYQPGLMDYQYHGSVYGIIPTQVRDALKPVGEWNSEEIYMKGNYIKVTLNGIVITEGDIKEAVKNGTYDKKEHPGLFNKSGHIGFLGHGSELWFKNIRIKRL